MIRALILMLIFLAPAVHALEFNTTRIGERLRHPWGMDFLTPDTMLITERRGTLWRYDLGTGQRTSLQGVPEVVHAGQGGMLDVLVHDGAIYLCYSRPMEGGAATAVSRARLEGDQLVNTTVIFTSNTISSSPYHFGCRLGVADGHLYITMGERGDRDTAQHPALHAGAVVRLRPDGRLPKDNPQPGGWAEGLYTKGHRNPQGLAIHPETGALWIHEHGPKGGDEINILHPGANYGWPVVSHGREYTGGQVGDGQTSAPGFTDPVWVWVPSIAPSGMVFYQGEMFPEWQGSLLVGSLKFKSLYVVEMRDGLPTDEAAFLRSRIGRIRDIAIAPDGAILLLSDERDGGLYRVVRR